MSGQESRKLQPLLQRTDTERLEWLQNQTIYRPSVGESREADAGFVSLTIGELEARLIDSEGNLRAAIDAAIDAQLNCSAPTPRTRGTGP